MVKQKRVCAECDWCGDVSELLLASSPFDSEVMLHGCPQCKGVDCCRVACDEPGCCRPVTSGTMTPKGYRNTCRDHVPERKRDG